jgi:hypothetical protein
LLSKYCYGFKHAVDLASESYRAFMCVMNKRNFVLHGNIDSIR